MKVEADNGYDVWTVVGLGIALGFILGWVVGINAAETTIVMPLTD